MKILLGAPMTLHSEDRVNSLNNFDKAENFEGEIHFFKNMQMTARTYGAPKIGLVVGGTHDCHLQMPLLAYLYHHLFEYKRKHSECYRSLRSILVCLRPREYGGVVYKSYRNI